MRSSKLKKIDDTYNLRLTVDELYIGIYTLYQGKRVYVTVEGSVHTRMYSNVHESAYHASRSHHISYNHKVILGDLSNSKGTWEIMHSILTQHFRF